jgi:hypothetical protein
MVRASIEFLRVFTGWQLQILTYCSNSGEMFRRRRSDAKVLCSEAGRTRMLVVGTPLIAEVKSNYVWGNSCHQLRAPPRAPIPTPLVFPNFYSILQYISPV